MTKTYFIQQDSATPLSITVTIPDGEIDKYSDYIWDSRLGLVSAMYEGKRIIVPASGTVSGVVETKPIIQSGSIKEIDYDYWYY